MPSSDQATTPLLQQDYESDTPFITQDPNVTMETSALLPNGEPDDAAPDSLDTNLYAFRQWICQQQRRAMVAAHLLALLSVVTVMVWIHQLGGLSWKRGESPHVFNWHPVLMITAFAFMTVASLSFRLNHAGTGSSSSNSSNSSSNNNNNNIINGGSASWTRSQRKALHAMAWTVAALCMVIGLIAVFRSHNDAISGYIANLYSLHSWIGLTVFVLYSLQFLSAFFAFGAASSLWWSCKRILQWRSSPSPEVAATIFSDSFKAKLLVVHYYVGPAIYMGAMVAILLGIQEKEGFVGCAYKVESADIFPPAHFYKIPLACRVSHLLGLLVLLTGICMAFALSNSGITSL